MNGSVVIEEFIPARSQCLECGVGRFALPRCFDGESSRSNIPKEHARFRFYSEAIPKQPHIGGCVNDNR